MQLSETEKNELKILNKQNQAVLNNIMRITSKQMAFLKTQYVPLFQQLKNYFAEILQSPASDQTDFITATSIFLEYVENTADSMLSADGSCPLLD